MSEQPAPSVSGDVTSDDKLWAALAYPIPFIPIITLLMEDKKDRPFIKAHNAQALAFHIAFYVIVSVTGAFLIGLCLWPIGVLAQLYWAYKAYQGEYITIPVITDFVKNQGWA